MIRRRDEGQAQKQKLRFLEHSEQSLTCRYKTLTFDLCSPISVKQAFSISFCMLCAAFQTQLTAMICGLRLQLQVAWKQKVVIGPTSLGLNRKPT